MDQLDSPENQHLHVDDKIECKRKGFWQLVHTDYVFQLYFGKPPMITDRKFHVNLPSLQHGSSLDATSFILNSRITFLVTEFFEFLGETPMPKTSALDFKIDGLVAQIESRLEEWKIVQPRTHRS